MAFSVGHTQVGIDLSRVDGAAQFPLGKEVVGDDGATYRYIKTDASISVNALVKQSSGSSNHTILETAAVTDIAVGVAPIALGSGFYGWIIVRGIAVVKAAAGTTALSVLAASATFGTGSMVTISASPTQAEVQRAVVAAGGVGVQALTAVASGVVTALLS